MADRYLEQGPEAKPRNYLADMVRDYGLYGLSDKLNSPTSGVGMLVDAVGGLGYALFVQPAQSFNRLMQNGYESGNPQSAEDAFNVAGAAMVGGLAAPRPSNSLGALSTRMQKQIHEAQVAANPGVDPNKLAQVYRTKDGEVKVASPAGNIHAKTTPDGIKVSSSYLDFGQKGNGYGSALYDKLADYASSQNAPLYSDSTVSPLAQRMYDRYGKRFGVDENSQAIRLRDGSLATVDGSPVYTVSVPPSGGAPPPLPQPGTVYSPLTGELLYANGGKQGAATGAALNAAGERPVTVRAYRGSNNEFDISQFDPAASNPAWRTNEGALFFGSQDVANFYGAPQTAFDQQLYSSIVQKHTKPDGRINPQAIAKEYDEVAPQQGAASVMPADINTSNFGQANLTGYRWDADEGARLKAKIDAAKAQGKDGLIINGMMDASGYPDTQYAVWGRGNVASPLTGETIYSGGRPGAAVGAAANAVAERPGIRAYHGSPHDFDKFDMSKIGTGEGAQAYGHGLYFAESEGVARSYRNKLSDGSPTKGGQNYDSSQGSMSDTAYSLMKMTGGNVDVAVARAEQLAKAYNDPNFTAVADELRNGNWGYNSSGKMYEVRINANPDDFLDWDKPLNQQSEKVRGVIASDPTVRRALDAETAARNESFKARADEFERQGNAEAAALWRSRIVTPENAAINAAHLNDILRTHVGSGYSAALKDAGIPGIRYLDQGSRTAGEGSRNYVVFDDNLIEILRKYGLLGMIGGGAVAGGLQSDPQKQTDWARKMQPGDA